MQTDSRWQMRIENSCLFLDDIRQKRVILQHNARSSLRPYIHPLRTIEDTVCLTEDSPQAITLGNTECKLVSMVSMDVIFG